tara:strand:- start:161 stop:649 length:489 start_codon:yes stop_codon:yes gene_type:complete
MKYSFLIGVILMLTEVNAQSIGRTLITPYVNEASANGMKLNGSLGESSVSTARNNISIITQGFQQPSDVFGVGLEEDYEELSIKLYPSIVTDIIRIEFDFMINDIILRIYNINGQMILKKEIGSQIGNEIVLSDLSEGVYYAHFSSVKYQKQKTVQIIKKNK